MILLTIPSPIKQQKDIGQEKVLTNNWEIRIFAI